MTSSKLLALAGEEQELLKKAKKLNTRRRRNFKTSFGSAFWLRFSRHTAEMGTPPAISKYLYTMRLHDTYRGSDKDEKASDSTGDHAYSFDKRKEWANEDIQDAIKIILDSRDLLEDYLNGEPFSWRRVSRRVEALIDESLNELIDKRQPKAGHIKSTIWLPKGMTDNPTLKELQAATLEASFFPVPIS